MRKKIFMIIGLLMFSLGNVNAEVATPDNEKKISYAIALDFANTYLWRGGDTYIFRMNVMGTPSGVFNFSPSIFPSVTVSVPEGLSFNLWAAAAMAGREAAEGDLKSFDEIDITGSYTIEDKSGTFASSFIGYLFPTANSTGDILPSYAELVFAYTAPWDVLNPSVNVAAAFGGSNYEYASLSLSHEFEAGILTISPKVLFGFWYINDSTGTKKGHLDINIPFTFAINDNFEAHVGLTGCYRIFGFESTESPFIFVANIGTSYSF